MSILLRNNQNNNYWVEPYEVDLFIGQKELNIDNLIWFKLLLSNKYFLRARHSSHIN